MHLLQRKKTGAVDLSASYAANLYTSIENGDIYYEAGFWSPKTSSVVNSCKTVSAPIGIVFGVGLNTATERTDGYTHAWVMALKDAQKGCLWAASGSTFATTQATDKLFEPTITLTAEAGWRNLFTDYDGYLHCKTAKARVNTFTIDNLPAMYYAENYKISVESPVLSSGWYLPSIGQLFKFVAYGIGDDMTNTSNWNLNTNNCYWSKESTTDVLAKINAKFTDSGFVNGTTFDEFITGTGNRQYWSSTEQDGSFVPQLHNNPANVYLHSISDAIF